MRILLGRAYPLLVKIANPLRILLPELGPELARRNTKRLTRSSALSRPPPRPHVELRACLWPANEFGLRAEKACWRSTFCGDRLGNKALKSEDWKSFPVPDTREFKKNFVKFVSWDRRGCPRRFFQVLTRVIRTALWLAMAYGLAWSEFQAEGNPYAGRKSQARNPVLLQAIRHFSI